MKIYTKTGDDGTTGLQGNSRVLKSNPRIIAYGTVDEANASLGIALTHNLDTDLQQELIRIQNELFILGADLSNPTDGSVNRITEDMVEKLEQKIDDFDTNLEPLSNFILPGGDIAASHIHMTRTIIRRAESFTILASQTEKISENCIKYLNRLSDYLFVIARIINKRKGMNDTLWESQKR